MIQKVKLITREGKKLWATELLLLQIFILT